MNEHHDHEPENQAPVPVSPVAFFLVYESTVVLAPPAASTGFPPAKAAFLPLPALSEIYHPPRMA
jgi:hypothetical protein